jgi:hypothetical protein
MQFRRGASEAALLGHRPEVPQVMIIEPIHARTICFGLT